MRRATSVDDYLAHAEHWPQELVRLREILFGSDRARQVATTGLIFAFSRNRFVGSYFCFNASRRGKFAW